MKKFQRKRIYVPGLGDVRGELVRIGDACWRVYQHQGGWFIWRVGDSKAWLECESREQALAYLGELKRIGQSDQIEAADAGRLSAETLARIELGRKRYGLKEEGITPGPAAGDVTDALVYGMAISERLPDGRLERVDPSKVRVVTNPGQIPAQGLYPLMVKEMFRQMEGTRAGEQLVETVNQILNEVTNDGESESDLP